jgi:hypothetical protein
MFSGSLAEDHAGGWGPVQLGVATPLVAHQSPADAEKAGTKNYKLQRSCFQAASRPHRFGSNKSLQP